MLCFNLAYASSDFPYFVGGLKWSGVLRSTDGRSSFGQTNGCVKLNAQKQPVLDNGNFIFDSEMCTKGSRSLVVVAHSEAASDCDKIGGRLPSKQDLEKLIRSFEHSEESFGPRLTYKGVEALKNAFDFYTDDTQFYQHLWSSSVAPAYSADENTGSFFFNGERIDTMLRFEDTPSVRCIEGRQIEVNKNASRELEMSCGVYEGDSTLRRGDFTLEYGDGPISLFSHEEYEYRFYAGRVTNYDQSHAVSLFIVNTKNNEIIAEAYGFSETGVPHVTLAIKGMPSAYCRPKM